MISRTITITFTSEQVLEELQDTEPEFYEAYLALPEPTQLVLLSRIMDLVQEWLLNNVELHETMKSMREQEIFDELIEDVE